MSCSCGDINCCCEILCSCLKKSCVCEKCSELMHPLCKICGLPFASADQFSMVKCENVCSCFIRESTLSNKTKLLNKPANTVYYIPVPVFYPLPLVPNHQFWPRIHGLPNVGKDITNHSLPGSLEFGPPSTSIGSSINSTSDSSVLLRDNCSGLNNEQFPKDVSGEMNISLPIEEIKGSGSSVEELDKNSNPHEKSHQSAVPGNAGLKEQLETSMNLSESEPKHLCGINENQSTNSTIDFINPEQPSKANMSNLQLVSVKSEPPQNSRLVASLNDATQADPSIKNRPAQHKIMEQDLVQSSALKNQLNGKQINLVHPIALMDQPHCDVHCMPLVNQPKPGSKVISKALDNQGLVFPPSPSNPKVTEMCNNLGSSTTNDTSATNNVPNVIYANQNLPIYQQGELWHPQPFKSSLEPMKRLINKTFNYEKSSNPESKSKNDLKPDKNNFQLDFWEEWLNSFPPTFP